MLVGDMEKTLKPIHFECKEFFLRKFIPWRGVCFLSMFEKLFKHFLKCTQKDFILEPFAVVAAVETQTISIV